MDQTEAKTKNQQKNDAKREAKMAKFKAKQDKVQFNAPAAKKEKEPHASTKASSEKKEYTPTVDEKGKKSIDCVMPESYCPIYVEAFWYDWWEKEGFFQPEYHEKLTFEKSNEKFVMVIPPPNVTGTLHLGHALTNSVEDAITRWNRMCGKKTIWLPGCDHAGIATQVVVEKKLMKERKLTRHDLGREEFLKEVWKWKEEKGHRIYDQLRSLGSSCDWQRKRFTMDPDMSRAVTEAFVRLYDRGLIYRSVRLVNWSCTLKSAISDIEVDKMEITGRTPIQVPGYAKPIDFGVITSFAYPLEDGSGEIVVATTRLETMLGDTGIAVHPTDDRYKHVVGKFAKHPLLLNKRIPIVADEFVDKEFGTGAVKLTPAHDHNDWEVGLRHKLPAINIFKDDGTLNAETGSEFCGLKRFDARQAVRVALEKLNLLRGDKDNPMAVPLCSRTKDVIEPLIKPQWYLKCQNLADKAMEAVRQGDLKIIPDMYVRTWNSWLIDCHDWCISRQLWWGHRIPVYLIKDCDPSQNDSWVAARDEQEAIERASKKLSRPKEQIVVVQDEDVLDTWFSSQLFPFSSFGWPDENSRDLKDFYPGSLLETGHDIIFFWVARMVMIGLELTDKLPFHTVYLHPMVRDAHGKKMSKSLGNAIDPVDVIQGISLADLQAQLLVGNLDPREVKRAQDAQAKDFPSGIPQCGTDALRFALCAYTSPQGRNINLDILRVQGYRFFCNKLWNATRFALYHFLGLEYRPPGDFTLLQHDAGLSGTDRWILRCLAHCVKRCDEAFRSYNFPEATTACYDFWLYQLCDVYLEYAKGKSKDPLVSHILYTCLEFGLKLIHPFMPFVSEELYQRLPARPLSKLPPSLCVAKYPEPADVSLWIDQSESLENELDFQFAYDIVRYLRSLRAEYNLVSSAKSPRPKVQLIFSNRTLLDRCNKAGFISQVVEMLAKIDVKLATADKTQVKAKGCVHHTVFRVTQIHSTADADCSESGKTVLQPSAENGTASADYCVVYTELAGLVDLSAEWIKTQKKLEQSRSFIKTLKGEQARAEYLIKVPQVKRDQDTVRLQNLELELAHLLEMEQNLTEMGANVCCQEHPVIGTLGKRILASFHHKSSQECSAEVDSASKLLGQIIAARPKFTDAERADAMNWLNWITAIYKNDPVQQECVFDWISTNKAILCKASVVARISVCSLLEGKKDWKNPTLAQQLAHEFSKDLATCGNN